MFDIPSEGFLYSVNKHNCRIELFCDWIEASLLFQNKKRISKPDIVDILIENNIYIEEDFAYEWVEYVWSRFFERGKILKECWPFEIDSQIIKKKRTWKESSAYSFCLFVTMTNYYKKLKKKMKIDYNQQGVIFENLSAECLEILFFEWFAYKTGWSKENTNFDETLEEISQLLEIEIRKKPSWAQNTIKDLGLDILLYKKFDDFKRSNLCFFVQCASGANYKSKFKSPDLKIWKKFVEFSIDPILALTTPFSVNKDNFEKYTTLSNGLFVDRFRLLSFKLEDDLWIDDKLKKGITKFINPYLKMFPKLN